MGRDTIQLENAVSTISQEYLLEFTPEYGIPEGLHLELPGPEETIVEFPEGKVGVYIKFFEFENFCIPISQFLYDILGYYQIHLSQLSLIGAAKVDEKIFPTVVDWRTNAPKDRMPVANSYSAADVTILSTHHMDLFNLISAPNPTKVKTGTRPRTAHEVPLLTVTASRVIEMEDTAVTSESSGTPSTIEKSKCIDHEGRSRNRPGGGGGRHGAPCEQRAPQNGSSKEAATEIPIEKVSTTEIKIQFSVGSPESGRSTSIPSVVGSPGGIYQPGWGVTNDCRLDTPDACQDMVDHIVPPGYFSKLRHLSNADFLSQYNINLARQVAMGSQLRLRFEQEVRLLKKARSKIAKQDQRIQVREEKIKKLGQEIQSLRAVESKVHGLQNQTKNLKTLLEAEVDMKKAAEAKNAELSKELDSLRVQFSDLQVTGEEKIKVAFEEFKKYEDDKVEQRCAKMDARLDKLSVDFDEELYSHMLTAIVGRRWVIGHDLRLAVMKCAESSEIRQAFANVMSTGLAKGMSEGLKYGIEHEKADRDLADIEAYDPEANSKLVKALQDLKDLKYPMVDQLESDLRPSSSQLKILVYPEVRDPKDPWAVKEEMLLEDAIAANISRAKKKKKCRVGLALLLADAATQTKAADKEAR
ncbi:hypothetical protein Tco_1171035, partial [Tanacetum coccineum]